MSKARIISTSGFLCRAFGEQEDEGNSVGSNSLGGALADYNMQVCISLFSTVTFQMCLQNAGLFTKNINVCHFTFLHCVFSNVFVLPRISMFDI